MATKVGGTARLLINGTQYPLRGNLTISLGNISRESIVGIDQYHGVKETPVASWIEMDVTDMGDIDISLLQGLDDVTVNVELANGKQAVLRNAAQINPVELNAVDGQFTLRFESSTGSWL